eukprot:13902087-Alexandrium_andersonii.AAC.1
MQPSNRKSRADLDWILELHQGRELELLQSICDKYGVDISSIPVPAPTTGPSLAERIRQRPLRSLAARD